jgi:hypothetical protein
MFARSTTLISEVLDGLFAGLRDRLLAEMGLVRASAPSPEHSYMVAHTVRLACAQHWAAGGAMSGAEEAWRPICLAVAIAALLVRDENDLQALLERFVADAAGDPELQNIWQQAAGELRSSRAMRGALGIAFVTGYREDGSPDWNYPYLRTQAEAALVSAQIGARKLLDARRVPSAATEPPGAKFS